MNIKWHKILVKFDFLSCNFCVQLFFLSESDTIYHISEEEAPNVRINIKWHKILVKFDCSSFNLKYLWLNLSETCKIYHIFKEKPSFYFELEQTEKGLLSKICRVNIFLYFLQVLIVMFWSYFHLTCFSLHLTLQNILHLSKWKLLTFNSINK